MKENKNTSLLTCIIFLLFPLLSFSQHKTVTGKVTDLETKEPLVGAVVRLKGSDNAAISNIDGLFSIDLPKPNGKLVASYIGYESKTIPIAENTTTIDFLLQNTSSLEEIVVVGYGTQKAANLVGAVSTANIGDVVTRPSVTIANTLQGAVPGLNIRSYNGGDPASVPAINIRGFNSINGGSPLVLIDGIEGSIANLNPNDIESISILKDAGSAAIYGARGAFGVVLITTKTGEEGVFKVNYSNNFGTTSNVARTDFVTNPYTYAKWADEAIGSYHSGCYVCYEGEDWEIAKKVGNGELEPFYEQQADGSYKFFNNVNYYDLLFKKNRSHQVHNLSVSGGSKQIKGMMSGRIYDRERIQNIRDSKLKRYNLNVNLIATPNNWLELSAISRMSNRFDEEYAGTKNGWGGEFGVSKWRDLFPNYPAFVDGYGVSVGRTRNGYVGRLGALQEGAAHREWVYENLTNTLAAKLTPIQQLEVNMNYSYQVDRTDRTFTNKPFSYLSGNELKLIENAGLNRYEEDRWKDIYKAINIYGTFTETIKNDHNFKLLLGFNQEEFDRDRIGASIDDLLTTGKGNINFGTEYFDMSGSTLEWALQGYFGRFNYDYKGKYLLEINTRYDGSSRFPDGDRWGLFPSIAAGWQINEEDFWKNSVGNTISTFKLRGSYGELGNQSVGVNTFRQLMGLGRTSWLFNGTPDNYARIPSPLPSNIGWETITSTNVGFNLGFLNDKLTTTFDFYERNTSDMYLPGQPLPAVFGASEPRRNYASMQNRGFEFTTGYKTQFDVGGSPLRVDVSANISNNKATITKFDNPNGLLSTFREGQEVGEILGYRIDGQFQSDEEAAAFEQKFGRRNISRVYRGILDYGSNSDWNYLKGGDLKYVDTDGDGEINNGNNTVDDPGDLVRIGNAMPQFPFGFNVQSSWKGFELSLIGQGIAKQDWYPSGPLYWATFHRPYVSFIRKDLLDKVWDPEHPNDPERIFPQRQRAYNGLSEGRMSANNNDHFLTNIGYFRMKNMTLGYSLPHKLIEKASVDNLRIYLSGENMITWRFGGLTKYLDPEEVGSHVSYSNPNYVNAKPDRDTQLYPISKTFSVGIEIGL